MIYDPSMFGDESTAGIVWYDADSGTWVNAVDGNSGNNATAAEQGYQGSFDDFQNVYGTSVGQYVGAWGVDTTNHQAWAVLNHASDFSVNTVAAVPEPTTLALLATGVLMLLGYGWRRRSKT